MVFQKFTKRPIASTIDCSTYATSKFLANVPKDYASKTSSHVLNSKYFIQLLSKWSLDSSNILVRFDVTVVMCQDGKPNILADLVTYLVFRSQFYQLVSGISLRSHFSPVVANIFMEFLEQIALESSDLKPKLWLRCVISIFSIPIWNSPWKSKTMGLFPFLMCLSNANPMVF